MTQTLTDKDRKYINNTSSEQILKDEKLMVERNPLNLIEYEYLKIKTKEGKLIPLKNNKAQNLLFKLIKDRRKQGKPCFIWILKARQEGVSTESEAIMYSLTSQQPNRNSLIMANELDNSNNLFEMSKLYHECLEEDNPHLAPPLKKSNEKKLEFDGIHSQIIIQTADKKDRAGRSYTFQYIHLSECAFFADLRAVLSGLSQCVPNHPDTLILGETTANGMGDFYDLWKDAVEGKTDWIPFFIPWYWMDEYSMDLQEGYYPLDGISYAMGDTKYTFLDEETQIREDYPLSDEQINWRRWAIINKCQGNIRLFKQEYPISWEEAFSLSGDKFFDSKGMEFQRSKKIDPIDIGEIYKEDNEFKFRSNPKGRIEMHEYPGIDEEYIITADASEAIGKDEASVYVLNKRTNETAAVVYGQHTSPELADMGINLATFYNYGVFAPENKGYGTEVCRIASEKYGNMYRPMNQKSGNYEAQNEIGFNTNSVTRPTMLAQLNEEIKEKSTLLKSKALIEQCDMFINHYDTNGKFKKAEAEHGKQDGLVICRAIAGYIRRLYPYVYKFDSKNSDLSYLVEETKKKKVGVRGRLH